MNRRKKSIGFVIFLILQLIIAAQLVFAPFALYFSISYSPTCTELVATGNATFPPGETYIGGTSDDP
jgi:hypothetical protein